MGLDVEETTVKETDIIHIHHYTWNGCASTPSCALTHVEIISFIIAAHSCICGIQLLYTLLYSYLKAEQTTKDCVYR